MKEQSVRLVIKKTELLKIGWSLSVSYPWNTTWPDIVLSWSGHTYFLGITKGERSIANIHSTSPAITFPSTWISFLFSSQLPSSLAHQKHCHPRFLLGNQKQLLKKHLIYNSSAWEAYINREDLLAGLVLGKWILEREMTKQGLWNPLGLQRVREWAFGSLGISAATLKLFVLFAC